MIIYPDTEKELSMSDYKPLPTLRGLSLAELRELSENIEQATENAWIYHSDLLALALDMDSRKIDLYIHFAERRENGNV